MWSSLKLESKSISFGDINLSPVGAPLGTSCFCCPTFHPDSRAGILTRESALLLLQLHPLVLWTKKHYCVLGRRVLHLVSPHVYRTDILQVGYLPSASKDEVERLMAAEPILNQITFATQGGSQAIFATARKMDQNILATIAPVLTGSIESIANLFPDCSASTLYKHSAKYHEQKA